MKNDTLYEILEVSENASADSCMERINGKGSFVHAGGKRNVYCEKYLVTAE